MFFMLEREKTTSTPYVLVDEEKKYIKLAGRSFNENIIEFFTPIISWLDTYLASDFEELVFECNMDYFNSSTVKILSTMIKKMDKYSVDGNKVIINWVTKEDNDIIIECGEDFEEDIENLEFNMVID